MRLRSCLTALISLALPLAAQFQWPNVRTEQRGQGSETKYTRNLNGVEVPVQSVTEEILENTPALLITERTTVKYDPNGRPGPPEKERIERHRTGTAERIVRTVTLRDTNGNAFVSEVSRTSTNVAGDTTATRTEVEIASPNGRLKLSKVEETRLSQPDENNSTQTTSILSSDVNGRFRETGRRVTEYRKSKNGEITITSSEYSIVGDRDMALVKKEVRRVDGNHAEVDFYEANAPGRTPTGEPQLVRRQNIDRTMSTGQLVETTTVQPVGTDGKLEAPRPADRRICTGDCR